MRRKTSHKTEKHRRGHTIKGTRAAYDWPEPYIGEQPRKMEPTYKQAAKIKEKPAQ